MVLICTFINPAYEINRDTDMDRKEPGEENRNEIFPDFFRGDWSLNETKREVVRSKNSFFRQNLEPMIIESITSKINLNNQYFVP